MPRTHRPRGLSVEASHRAYERERGNARARGYDGQWERSSGAYRSAHPLCEYCLLEGRTSAAELVDHLYPHRGNRLVFWMTCWWVSCCRACHDGMKQRLEHLGRTLLDDLAHRLARPVWSDRMP